MLADVWSSLEAEAVVAGPSEVRRRIHPESAADLWLVVYSPGQRRALRVSVSASPEELGDLPLGSGIETRLNTVPSVGPALEVSLTNNSYVDLFDAFVADIASAASSAPNGQDVPRLVAARVRRWQAFLREQLEGLSSERQRGLFGELHVLACVIDAIGPEPAVTGWVGPQGASQDFDFGRTAVEVKTSAGKNPQRVRISSERQLDDSSVNHLILWHLSVDERTGTGEELPACVERLRELVDNTPAAVRFEDTLFAAGYHDAHARRYTTGYSLRSSDLFEVRAGFPRLVEADCPDGLGDVHYSLELGALASFRIDRRSLVAHLTGPGDYV